MKRTREIVTSALLWLLWIGGLYYVLIPPMNIHSRGCWLFLLFVVLVPAVLMMVYWGLRFQSEKCKKAGKGFSFLGGGLLVLMILAGIYGSPMFHAASYASILKIEDFDFTKDIDEATALNRVALMDTESARILGNRKIGSLSQVVSQFNVDREYSQIDYQGAPVKVAPLEYAGFFKYLANRSKGVPGYVKVDPVGQNAEYVELARGMTYVPSSYFNRDLERHMRFAFPTGIMKNLHLETNEKGKPYYVASVMDYDVGLFGGETVRGAAVCDPVTGACKYYKISEVPRWIDNVFYGNLLVKQYNWYGQLSNGYLNSLFSKKGCKKCTETEYAAAVSEDSGDQEEHDTAPDYGYISKDGDIWIYTGVTSVNDDASNIGFIMVNERTGEAHFFTIPGADENSAMAAAQGEVQEKGYVASFPSLINVSGTATYIMVLKDANSIVKLYAMVNVEQYNIVVTASDLKECYSKYQKKIGINPQDEGQDSKEALKEETIIIADMQYADIEGNTYVYISDQSKQIYRLKFADYPEIMLVKVGDTLRAGYLEGEQKIREIKEIKEILE